jgi:pimeloyl-ACP methyl ester carboxylesterase
MATADAIAITPAWLTAQRWFRAKSRAIRGTAVVDELPLSATARLVVAEAAYADGGPADRYLVPLVGSAEPADGSGAWRALVGAMADGAEIHGRHGRLRCSATPALAELLPSPHEAIDALVERRLGVEQSNTSVVLGERLVLRLVRRLEPGRNPDIVIGAGLAARGRRVVALDLRGRGRSPGTGPGTYGWPAHARDVLDAAARLADGPVDLVGHSMGAFVALQAAAVAPEAVRSVALIDGAGAPEPAAMPAIRGAVSRLGTVFPSREELVALVRRLGTIEPWSERWERYLEYDLEPAPGGGVRARTDRDAVMEDLAYGEAHDASDLWPALRAPALLVRALRPLPPDGGHIVTPADAERFGREVGRVVEVDANHYGVVMHVATIEAVAALRASP